LLALSDRCSYSINNYWQRVIQVDYSKRENLIERIYELGFTGAADNIIAVTLDEFFEGNEDLGSLACNLDPHPGMEALYYHLQRFANDNEAEVLVEIYELDEDDEETWPYAERVYFIGSVEREALEDLLDNVFASEIEELEDFVINGESHAEVYAIWWD